MIGKTIINISYQGVFQNGVKNLCIFHLILQTIVAVTFYLRLRNEFPAKNQASDWLTQQVNQLEA